MLLHEEDDEEDEAPEVAIDGGIIKDDRFFRHSSGTNSTLAASVFVNGCWWVRSEGGRKGER